MADFDENIDYTTRLYELSANLRLDRPDFFFEKEVIHKFDWYTCKCSTFIVQEKTQGKARTKREAKHIASHKMIQKLEEFIKEENLKYNPETRFFY